jgi:uncharacterized protein
MNRWILGCSAAGFALWLAGATQAASFDCKTAKSAVEQTICKDPELDSYDQQLQGAYAGALDRSNDPEKIRAEQRAWIRQRDACADARCMTPMYVRRIDALAKVDDEPKGCPGDSTPQINACMAEYGKRADRELDRYVAAARKEIADSTADSTGDRSKGAMADFKKAQAAWVAYRKAECSAVYDEWSDGTIRGAMYEDCYRRVTKARSNAIWETWLHYMDDTPPLLPKPVG